MTDTPNSFAEALELEVRATHARDGMCRIAIRKVSLKPADREKVDEALASQVSAPKIGAAFKLIAENGEVPIGLVTVKKHRTQTCSCYKPGGDFYDGGAK